MTTSATQPTESRYSVSNNMSYMYQVYCSYILLFKNTGGKPNFLPFGLLQKSLTALLRKHYQPVAGWFDVKGDEIDVVYYSDKFNDPPLAHQTLDISYEELTKHVNDSNIDLFVPKGPNPLIAADNQDIPMFLAKATYIDSNQGMVLGVNYHHSLMDGSTFWEFLHSWSIVAKQLCQGVAQPQTVTIPNPPSFGIPQIKANEPTSGKSPFDHSEYILVDPKNCKCEFAPGADKIKETIMVISADQQLNIRKMAQENGVSFTIMLCAIFWKELSRLRQLSKPETGDSTSRFSCAVNIRDRLDLPSNQCASLIINASDSMAVGEMAQMDLSEVASRVKHTVTKTSTEYVSSSIDFIASQRKKELKCAKTGEACDKAMLAYICPAEVRCIVSSSRTFPVYKLDFGYGVPEYVRPPYLPFDGCLRIWPTPSTFSSDENERKQAPIEIYLSQPEYIDFSLSPLLSKFEIK